MTLHAVPLSFLTICLLFGAAGCGGGENDAPRDSTITINPASTSLTQVGPCRTYDETMRITVQNAAGVPLNDTRITIYLDLSLGATTAGGERMALFDNGVGPLPYGYTTTTGDNGTKSVVVRMNSTGCGATYTGQMAVSSGSVYKTAEFSMQ